MANRSRDYAFGERHGMTAYRELVTLDPGLRDQPIRLVARNAVMNAMADTQTKEVNRDEATTAVVEAVTRRKEATGEKLETLRSVLPEHKSVHQHLAELFDRQDQKVMQGILPKLADERAPVASDLASRHEALRQALSFERVAEQSLDGLHPNVYEFRMMELYGEWQEELERVLRALGKWGE